MTRTARRSGRRIARLTAPPVTQTGRFVLDADDVLICMADPPPICAPQTSGWSGPLAPTVTRHPLAVGSSDAIVFLDGAQIDVLSLDETDAAFESDRGQPPGKRLGITLVHADGGWDLYAGGEIALQESGPHPMYTLTGEGSFWVALSHALARWESGRWLIVPNGLGPAPQAAFADPDQPDQRSPSTGPRATLASFAQPRHCR